MIAALLPVVASVAALCPPQSDASASPARPAAPPATAELPRFQKPFVVEAGGQPIVAVTGHAAPFLVDLDGDGKRDLVVGMFGNDGGGGGGGVGRLYRNVGTDAEPRFDGHVLFTVDDVPASMESG